MSTGRRSSRRRRPRASRPRSGPTRSRRASASSPTTSRRPTTSSSARPIPSTRPSCSASWSACASAATSTRARTPASTARRARRSTTRTTSSTAAARSTAPSRSSRRSATRSSASPPTPMRCSSAMPRIRRSCCPQTRLNEVRSHVEGGLQDVSITRESVNWGVPLPWDSSQAIYVWIDALINYTSALTYARPGEDLTARLWPARWQLLGKDILRFHAVIWPAMLLSAGYELPRQLFIHGMLAGQDGHRMSKTRGNAMDYRPVATAYGAGRAALLPAARGRLRPGRRRRLLGHARPLPQRSRQRARQPRVAQHRDGDALPRRRHPGGGRLLPRSRRWRPRSRTPTSSASSTWTSRARSSEVWELVRALNRFVEARAPWELAKSDDPGAAAALDETLRDPDRGGARARGPAVALPPPPRRP